MYFQRFASKKILVVLGCLCSFLIGSAISWGIASKKDEVVEEEWLLPWEIEGGSVGVEEGSEEKNSFIVVDVKGEIKYPGIYTANSGDRVNDIILMAGGFTDNANDQTLNLAEKAYDEMVIYVPSLEEDVSGLVNAVTKGDTRLKINKATKEELTTLPGIGPSKAEAIIRYREENGPFNTVEDIVNVPGIGDKTMEQLKQLITVP